MLPSDLQPDQQPHRWDDHVCVYEAVFEPFTLQFAQAAIATLGLSAGAPFSMWAQAVVAPHSLWPTKVCASRRSTLRRAWSIASSNRAAERGVSIDAQAMDGEALQFEDASFDGGLSVLGIILFPDANRGLEEMGRVVHRGGRISVVTWTQPRIMSWPRSCARPSRQCCRTSHRPHFLSSCAIAKRTISARCFKPPA